MLILTSVGSIILDWTELATFIPMTMSTDLNDIRFIFDVIDMIVKRFLEKYNDDYLQPQTRLIAAKGITLNLCPLQLFTHVTHSRVSP